MLEGALIRVVWQGLPEREREAVLARPALGDGEVVSDGVSAILAAVRAEGDAAVRRLTERFDRVSLSDFEVTGAEKDAANRAVRPEVKVAIDRAASNIETFHRAQIPRPIEVETAPGLRCSRLFRPIQRVGLYVPGGTAPLPSTVLMLAIPARLAGCPTRILCSPPRSDGTLDPHVVVAALACGTDRLFKVGGAQAIAAMAFGTESVPKVEKVFGPGNAWVTEAKMQVARVAGGAAVNLPAGPSEVLVVADSDANPVFVAANLLSQAEHGRDSQVVLVSTSPQIISAVSAELSRQVETLPRREIARAALAHSRLVEVRGVDEALEVVNRYAPEHLILQVKDAASWVSRITSAGSVFLGPWTPEAVGDYASGTNHVLPTYGWAKAFGGVGVESFGKAMTVQELEREALVAIAPVVEALADVEGLDAHRRAVSLRVNHGR